MSVVLFDFSFFYGFIPNSCFPFIFVDGAVNGELHGVILLHIVFFFITYFHNSLVLLFVPLCFMCD